MFGITMRALVGFVVTFWMATAAHAQKCPDATSGEAAGKSALHGTVVYHDDLRQWLGLKLDRAACGEKEVQLVFPDAGTERHAKSLRGCKATAIGELYPGVTGYYSAPLAVSVEELKPDASCHPVAVEPDPAASGIPPDIQQYFASITVDYRGKGHVSVEVWKDRARSAPLKPWGAYVNYLFNSAADVIYVGCREGFRWKDVTQIPKTSKGPVEGSEDDAGVVLDDSVSPNVITFSCEKAQAPA
jgi:hypothetical protein